MNEEQMAGLIFLNFSSWSLSVDETIGGVIFGKIDEIHYRILLPAQLASHVKDGTNKAIGVVAEFMSQSNHYNRIYKAREVYWGGFKYTGSVYW